MIAVSTLQAQYDRSKNTVLQILSIKTINKNAKVVSEKSNTFWKAWSWVGRWGLKFPVPSQRALKTPNGTAAYKRLISLFPDNRWEMSPFPNSGWKPPMGRWEQREAVVDPGIAALDIGCTGRAIDRKKAFPLEASGILRTYTEQVTRTAPGTLQDPRPWC